jgi:hypothetical protein
MKFIEEFKWKPKQVKAHKKSGLFEILLNSGNACKKRMLLEEDDYFPKISIIFDKTNKTVKITDNGIGISLGKIYSLFEKSGVAVHKKKLTDLCLDNQIEQVIQVQERGHGIKVILAGLSKLEIISHCLNEVVGSKIEYDQKAEKVSLNTIDLGDFKGTTFCFNYEDFLNFSGDSYEVKELLDSINLYHGEIELSVTEVDTKIVGVKYPIVKLTKLIRSIMSMESDGDIVGFIEFLKEDNFLLSNRDLMGLDEKHYKFKLLSILELHSSYTVISETEIDHGYIDILLKNNINSPNSAKFEWLIELKYVKKSNSKKLQEIRKAGIDQARSYAESRIIVDTIEKSTLKVVVITFLGKSDVFLDYVQ